MKKEASQKIKQSKPKQMVGKVVSTKMQKTVVVSVTTRKTHPLYHKVVTSDKRYKAQTNKELSLGDVVTIEQSTPYSKQKKWRVIKVQDNKKS